jgi:peptide chain release factor 2
MMNPAYLKITTGPKGERGGQQVGVIPRDVSIEHVPTGLKVSCGADRSQYRNRQICLAMLEYGLVELGWKEGLTHDHQTETQ